MTEESSVEKETCEPILERRVWFEHAGVENIAAGEQKEKKAEVGTH